MGRKEDSNSSNAVKPSLKCWYQNSRDEWTAHAGIFTLRVFANGDWRVEGSVDAWGQSEHRIEESKREATEFLQAVLKAANEAFNSTAKLA